LADWTGRAPRFTNVRLNLLIARLACCGGLRAGLLLDDGRIGMPLVANFKVHTELRK
jgi:hypothetical protein